MAYHIQCQRYEFKHGCPKGLKPAWKSTASSVQPSAPSILSRYYDGESVEDQGATQENADGAEGPDAACSEVEAANAAEEDFQLHWPQWLEHSAKVSWSKVFPSAAPFKHLDPDTKKPHVVKDLIELPYLTHLIDLVDTEQFGLLAHMGVARCGGHLSSAFVERVNSAGGQIMTPDRFQLDDHSVELETQLRINGPCREFFREQFKEEYSKAAAKGITAFEELTVCKVQENFAGETPPSQ